MNQEGLQNQLKKAQKEKKDLENLIAQQRSVLYNKNKKIKEYEERIRNSDSLYRKVLRNITSLFEKKGQLAEVEEKEKRMYVRLMKKGINYLEILKIEKQKGYEGLYNRLREVLLKEKKERKKK